MGFYCKKPIVIEAIQFREENYDAVREFCPCAHGPFTDGEGSSMYFVIPTLEGDHRATDGDYIIKGTIISTSL